jgi:hypothetical protein
MKTRTHVEKLIALNRSKAIPMIGRRFGRLTVLSAADPKQARSGKKLARWNCRCDCGQEKVLMGTDMRTDHTTSCGCFHKERLIAVATTHGLSKTPMYRLWSSMITRCSNKRRRSYKDYGGRGISVCDRWKNDFTLFLHDVGERPSPRHSLDRINNNGNYEPGNVRWSTAAVQARNTTRTIMITYQGKTKSLFDWAEEYGIKYKTLRGRICDRGWSSTRAIETPVRSIRVPVRTQP